jgi:hypothetical protein
MPYAWRGTPACDRSSIKLSFVARATTSRRKAPGHRYDDTFWGVLEFSGGAAALGMSGNPAFVIAGRRAKHTMPTVGWVGRKTLLSFKEW